MCLPLRKTDHNKEWESRKKISPSIILVFIMASTAYKTPGHNLMVINTMHQHTHKCLQRHQPLAGYIIGSTKIPQRSLNQAIWSTCGFNQHGSNQNVNVETSESNG